MKTKELKKEDLNRPVTLADMSRLFLENNLILIPLMGKMMDEKIKANNDILIPLLGKMMDEKIKANNEYIFANFNDQTNRIVNLFSGVIRIKKDGSFRAEIL